MPLPSIPTRAETIATHGEAGGKVAAVLPYHYPRSLLRAFGLLPVEVWGPPGRDAGAADAHLQAYTCSVIRGPMAFLMQGGLDSVELILVPHGCDSLQGLGSVLLDFAETPAPVETFYLPRGAGRTASLEFVQSELLRLRLALEGLTRSSPSDEVLLQCVKREEAADAALGLLLTARRQLPLSNQNFYRLVRSREYLPAESFTQLAETALENQLAEPSQAAGILLSGIVPEPAGLLSLLDEAGVLVSGDDLASSGRRVYPTGGSEKPLLRIAQRLLQGPPDSTRGDSVQARITHLKQLADASASTALLFLVVKFCEPELFYLPQLRAQLEDSGLRSGVVECDVTQGLDGGLETRLEAFLEMLG